MDSRKYEKRFEKKKKDKVNKDCMKEMGNVEHNFKVIRRLVLVGPLTETK